jgi:hypothetical protein
LSQPIDFYGLRAHVAAGPEAGPLQKASSTGVTELTGEDGH